MSEDPQKEPSVSTSILSAARHEEEEARRRPWPPSLAYNLWDHRTKLVLMVALLMAEFCFLPISLYYALWYRTSLRHGVIFAIITSSFGIVTGVEFALRSWRLLMPAPTYRPIGGHRWGLDATHCILSVVYAIMTAILVGASIPEEPLVRPLALPPTVFCLFMAVLLLASGTLHHRGASLPFRVSSTPAGTRLPPLTYTLVEDIVGVDGDAGIAYRQRLADRWQASVPFRRLLTQLNWLWGAGTLAGGALTMVLLWTTPRAVAYGAGWAVPMVVVCLLATATLYIVRHGLRRERAAWGAG